ncbi:hypothetical protein [Methylomonas sp. CM2]|uniref:hypothetical protein n=1 Tax=Methylomonas sp. CM2 TaxID=3417647 RepID=UPI003CF9450E
MKHPIKAGLLVVVLAHLIVGGAAIHAMFAWIFGGHDPVTVTAATSTAVQPQVLGGGEPAGAVLAASQPIPGR